MEAEFAPSFFEDEVTKIDLWVYWRLVRKHLRLIGAVVAGTVFVTLHSPVDDDADLHREDHGDDSAQGAHRDRPGGGAGRDRSVL